MWFKIFWQPDLKNVKRRKWNYLIHYIQNIFFQRVINIEKLLRSFTVFFFILGHEVHYFTLTHISVQILHISSTRKSQWLLAQTEFLPLLASVLRMVHCAVWWLHIGYFGVLFYTGPSDVPIYFLCLLYRCQWPERLGCWWFLLAQLYFGIWGVSYHLRN